MAQEKAQAEKFEHVYELTIRYNVEPLLKSTKVGDKMLLVRSERRRGGYTYTPVIITRTTKTRIIIQGATAEVVYKRDDGYRYGSHRGTVIIPDSKMARDLIDNHNTGVNEIEAERDERARLWKEAHNHVAWNTMTADQLAQVTELMNRFMSDNG